MASTATPTALFTPIPQKSGYPLLGNLPQIPKGKLVQFLMQTSKEFDGIFGLNFAGRQATFISSADLVAEACDETRFRKMVGPGVTMLRPLAGDGLFTAHSDEPNWGKAHRILMPAFGQRAMRGYFDAMLAVAQRLVDKWERQGPDADIVVTEDMTRLTLDTIALSGFGYDFASFDNHEQHPFVDAMVRALSEALGRVTRLPGQTKLMRGAQRQFESDNRYLHTLVDEVIEQRRRQPTQSNDLLNLMLEARDPQTDEALDDLNIRFQVLTFLVAGHETTSGLLSFTLYELLRNPGVLAQAYAEVDSVLPGDRVPVYADLARLDVIDRILKESLRLWPTAPAFSVGPYQDEVIGGRYRISKDVRVTVLATALHRNPAYWEHPDRFDIDRFTPENESRRHPHAYKPFGNGERACIGRQFALTEAKLALAMILRRFKLRDPHDYSFRIAESLTIKPEGFVLRASPRLPHERLSVMASATTAVAQADAATLPSGGGRKLRVAFGSSLGTARELAGQIAHRAAQAGFETRVQELDELIEDMPAGGLLVVVASTYNGKPPETGRRFDIAIDAELAEFRAPGLTVAVLGCGNSQWATYQAFPRRVAEFFARAGAQILLARGEADGNGDFDRMVNDWTATLWRSLDTSAGDAVLLPPVRIDYGDVDTLRQPVLPAQTVRLEVLANEELVSDPEGLWDFSIEAPRSSTRHLRLKLPEQVGYRTGDHLAVYPSNSEQLVDSMIERLGLQPHDVVRLRAGRAQPSGLPLDAPLTVNELLRHFVELQDVPSRAVIKHLQQSTRCPFTRGKLAELAGDDPQQGYTMQVAQRRLGLLDLLQQFPAIELGLDGLLTICPPIRPRLYSIASAPDASPGEVAITVGTVRAPALSGRGEFRGVASNHMAALTPGQVVLGAIRTPEPAFAPDASRPMILIGPGTGIAPFRGFLEQRSHEQRGGAKVPTTLLFYGCRHPGHDWLYRDELQAWEREGIVSIRLAVSTQTQGERFVQHALLAAAEEVWALWEQGAVVYVCGDGRLMAPAVRDALIAIHRQRCNCDHETSSRWLVEQMASGRYLQDVFN